MATAIGLGFTLSASAQRMASGINAGVVELQKLGYQAKKTSNDVSVLKNLAIGQALISGIRSTAQQFTSFISAAASSAAAVDDLSKRTGISTQTLQGYGLAAGQSGVSAETMGKSLQKLSLIQEKANNKNESAIQAFKAIGLSMKDLAGLSPEQTFEAVTDAIAQLPTVAKQSAAAIALFGKSGGELLPIFQEGTGYLAKMRKEAEQLGIVLSKEQMSGLAGLDDMIAKVTMAFAGLAAVAYGAYSIACVGATAATAALALSIRAMLASTGIGALVVGFGLLTGALIEYFVASDKSTKQETKATKSLEEQTKAAKRAREEAIESAKQKQVTKLLNDESIRKQFDDVAKDAEAFRKKLQDSLQIKSTAALEVSDIRTKEGAAAVFALQAGRIDPAVEAAREQIKKLEEIKKAIRENKPDETVDILGGAE